MPPPGPGDTALARTGRPGQYACTHCGRSSDAPGPCASCGADVRALERMPNRAVAPDRRRYALHRWFLGGTAAALIPLALAAAAIGGEFAVLLMLPALAIAVLFGGKLGQRIGRRRLRAQLVAWAHGEFARGPAVPIRDVPEGVARVAGVAVPVAVVRSPSGEPCLAYERRGALYDGDFSIAGAGGVFELEDGSGARALVRAEHVMILDGGETESELRVMPGARVEALGSARWVAATHDQAGGGGLRAAARVLQIDGSAQYPVLLRLLPPDPGRLPPG